MGQALCQVLGMVPACWEPTETCTQTTKLLLHTVWSLDQQTEASTGSSLGIQVLRAPAQTNRVIISGSGAQESGFKILPDDS